MIETKFRKCCNDCGFIDVEIDENSYIGADKHVCIYCAHMLVCERYRREQDQNEVPVHS